MGQLGVLGFHRWYDKDGHPIDEAEWRRLACTPSYVLLARGDVKSPDRRKWHVMTHWTGRPAAIGFPGMLVGAPPLICMTEVWEPAAYVFKRTVIRTHNAAEALATHAQAVAKIASDGTLDGCSAACR